MPKQHYIFTDFITIICAVTPYLVCMNEIYYFKT